MPERVRRVRRRKRIGAFPALEWLGVSRHHISPERLAVLIASVAVLLVVAFLSFTYGSKVYSGWRERRLLQRATVLLQHQDFDAATSAAQKALEMHPDSLPAFYILADATEKQNRIETVAWRSQIARLKSHDLDSQLNLASAALRFGELDTARKALEQVPTADRDRASYHVVAGWLARAQGDENGQQEHFAAAVKQEPANELYQFNLAILQIKLPDTEKRDSARQTLDRLSKVPQFRAGSLRGLLNDAIDRSDLAAADNLAQELQMSPQVTFGDYLLCLNLYRKLDDKKFWALLDKVKPVAARDASSLALLMDWMNNNGLSGEVLKWAEKLKPELTASPPPSIAVAEAFAAAKNWSRLKRWTRSGSWDNSDYLRLAYQAFATRQARQAGAEAEFSALWRSAERATEEDAQRELNLARLATRWNLLVEAEQLWLRVAKNAPYRREALDTLSRIYRSNNDLPNLYRVMQRLHEASPGEPWTAANYARLALLLDQNASEGHRIAKEAYDRAPTDVNCAVTYAFSLYGLGRTSAGLDIIKKMPNDQLHDPHAAVYVAVLFMDENQLDMAKDYIETAQRGPIFVEEKKLLDETLAKLNAPTPTPGPSVAGPAPILPLAKATPTPKRSTPPPVAPRPERELPMPEPEP